MKKHWEEIKERESFTIETTHKRKNGSIFPVEILINYTQTGGVEYNCAFARDISDRKKIEAQIVESRERFLSL